MTTLATPNLWLISPLHGTPKRVEGELSTGYGVVGPKSKTLPTDFERLAPLTTHPPNRGRHQSFFHTAHKPTQTDAGRSAKDLDCRRGREEITPVAKRRSVVFGAKTGLPRHARNWKTKVLAGCSLWKNPPVAIHTVDSRALDSVASHCKYSHRFSPRVSLPRPCRRHPPKLESEDDRMCTEVSTEVGQPVDNLAHWEEEPAVDPDPDSPK